MFMSAQRPWSGKPSLPEKVDNLHYDTHYLQLGLKPKKAWLCLTSFVVHPSVVCCLCTKMYVFNEQICPILFLLERLFGCMCVCVRLLTKSSVTYFSTFFCCDSVFIPVMITAQLGTTEYIYTMKRKKKDLYMQCRNQCVVLHNRLGCSFADTAFETSPLKGSQK